MKKFLSLVLALVMTMSLVTISAGAKDFDDNADITYVEAVDVMSDLKIVDGDKSGNFNPTAGLTRGAAAKIICNLILGPTTAAELNADTDPYPDVDKDSVFAGYIAYCAKEGIVGGYADGTFKPANPLTGYAFMKMLLGALGYDAAVEGYTGPNWSINVAKQAIGIGLNDNLVDNFNGSDFVTREEAMLYAFNTMKATMVDYDTTITIGDITVAGSNEYDVANNARVETIYEDGKMQFAEKYFTKLSLDDTTYDEFDRPTNTWTNGKETIGSYVDYTKIAAEYTVAVSGKELYDVVGKTAFDNYDFEAYVDGVENDFWKEISKNNKSDIGVTGNGALTQVFVDDANESVVITVVNTYLAQATMDYNAKKDSVSFEVFNTAGNHTEPVSGEDFDVEDVKEDDFVLVTYSKDEDVIVSIDEVEIIADTEIQKFKSGKTGNLTVDGTTYSYNEKAAYDPAVLDYYTGENDRTNLKDLTYNVYLDQYGYVIGVDLVETPDNYLFITGVDAGSSNLANKTWTANAIFMDGTVAVIDVNAQDSVGLTEKALVNSWFSYTVNKNDVYTVKVVDNKIESKTDVAQAQDLGGDQDQNVVSIDKKHISLDGAGTTTYSRVYGNDATIYLLAELDEVKVPNGNIAGVISDVDERVVGVKNASFQVWDKATTLSNLEKANKYTAFGAYTLYKENGYIIATVVVGASDTIASDLAYVISDKVSSESYDKTTGLWTWTRDVVVAGEKVEVTEVNDTGLSVLKNLGQYDWVTLKYDADGNVKKIGDVKDVVNTVNAANALIEQDTADVIVLDGNNESLVYKLIGSTLYDVTNDKEGFLIAEDVKVVLTQTVKKVETTTYDEGVKVLESTLTNLNEDKDGAHSYYFDAVIEDGAATVVAIVDKGADVKAEGPNGSTSTGAVDYVKVDLIDQAIVLDVNDKAAGAWSDAFYAAVNSAAKAALVKAGWMATGDVALGYGKTADTIKAVNMAGTLNREFTFDVIWG